MGNTLVKTKVLCRIWGFCGDVNIDDGLLGYCAV